MKKIIKIATFTGMLIVMAGAGAWYYVFIWSAHHHRNVEAEQGIPVRASALVDTFEKNEKLGNSIFLDKAVEVTGDIALIKPDQTGKQTIMLKSNDPMTGVLCKLKNNIPGLKEGNTITVKGICNGFLNNVVVTEAIPQQNNNKIE